MQICPVPMIMDGCELQQATFCRTRTRTDKGGPGPWTLDDGWHGDAMQMMGTRGGGPVGME